MVAFRFTPGCCCAAPCQCQASPSDEYELVIAGLVGCAALNGTYIVQWNTEFAPSSTRCIWTYTFDPPRQLAGLTLYTILYFEIDFAYLALYGTLEVNVGLSDGFNNRSLFSKLYDQQYDDIPIDCAFDAFSIPPADNPFCNTIADGATCLVSVSP